jgi:hypothetical protein
VVVWRGVPFEAIALTVTLGITAPVGSITLPVILDSPVCPKAMAPKSNIIPE